MMNVRTVIQSVFTCFCVLLLVSCGGGSDSSGPPPPKSFSVSVSSIDITRVSNQDTVSVDVAAVNQGSLELQ